MTNPAFDPKSTKPGSAGWYEPDGTYHPFNCDLEPDFEFAARVKDLGARSAIASLGGAIASASSTDQVRAAKSSIDALLYEMQHPKQTIYTSPANVAIAAGETVITPWIDIRPWRWIGWYLANVGAQVMTVAYGYWSEDPTGAAPYVQGVGAAATIAVGFAWYGESSVLTVNGWQPQYATPLIASYVQIRATSALGTSARVAIVGGR